ncbi:MAG TPA: glycosyltransferase family 2 protein, partial [Thermoleophilaceae bacterium]|nr:glycosyltransferase family 2 protein [Thermoleophilaceae bacterium]
MPAISLVLVVHREQGWLPGLASSVLESGFSDLELVAVDDASPDHAPEMLDELAERDPRVKVRHLSSRVGPGEGRNIGLHMAEGEYVWFVETTDLVEAMALPAGDVGLVPWARMGVLGERRAGGRPETAGRQLWNKLFRRELVADLRFGSGLGSELTVTWPASFRAERVDPLQGASYVRRRPPNAEPEPGEPSDVLAQYEAVLADAPESARPVVVTAMLRDGLSMLEDAQFFERLSTAYRRHRTGDEKLPGRALKLRAKLVERGDWAAYRALDRSIELRRELTPGRARQAAGRVKRALTPAGPSDREKHYRRRLRDPIDPHLAVFAA